MSILIQSSIMLLALVGLVSFMLLKLVDINKFNISLMAIMISLWIVSGLLGISIIKEGGSWKWPLLIGSSQLTQATFRVPLGKLSQKLQSRKIPVLLALFVMVSLSMPIIFVVSYTSLLFAAIGLGFFGATYGLQNQYWSENWNIRNIYITTGLVIMMYMIGKYTANIIGESITIDVSSMKWTMTTMLVLSTLVSFIYVVFHHEKKETILLDNKSSYAKHVSEMKLKHVLIFSTMISFMSIAINMITNNALVQYSIAKELVVTGWTVSTLSSLFIAFVLIRVINTKMINFIAHTFMSLGITFMIISSFAAHSVSLSFIGLMLAISGTAIYTTCLFGVMLHIDHKNTLLVLGIWLSVKSASIGTGQIIGGEVITYQLESAKYLLVGALVAVIISLSFWLATYKYTKHGFKLIKKLEFSEYHRKNNSEWK